MRYYTPNELHSLPDGEYVLEKYSAIRVQDGHASTPMPVYRVVAQANPEDPGIEGTEPEITHPQTPRERLDQGVPHLRDTTGRVKYEEGLEFTPTT